MFVCVEPESERSMVRFPNLSRVKTLSKCLILHYFCPPNSNGYLVTDSKWDRQLLAASSANMPEGKVEVRRLAPGLIVRLYFILPYLAFPYISLLYFYIPYLTLT
jgi:hypothetical protein